MCAANTLMEMKKNMEKLAVLARFTGHVSYKIEEKFFISLPFPTFDHMDLSVFLNRTSTHSFQLLTNKKSNLKKMLSFNFFPVWSLVPVAQLVERWTPRFGHWTGTESVAASTPASSSFVNFVSLSLAIDRKRAEGSFRVWRELWAHSGCNVMAAMGSKQLWMMKQEIY